MSKKDVSKAKDHELIIDQPADQAIEVLKADYLSKDFQKLLTKIQIPPLERVHIKGARYYFYYDLTTDQPIFFQGTSEFVRKVLPRKTHFDPFVEWMMSNFPTKEDMNLYVRRAAQYGSFMHAIFAIYWKQKHITREDVSTYLYEYMKREGISHELYYANWMDRIMGDLLAFQAFMIEHQVQPYAFEMPLWHPDGYATQIDLPCEMTVMEEGFHGEVYKQSSEKYGYKKGDPKKTKGRVRIKAIINFKSKQKGVFYSSEELQLDLERRIWNHWMEPHGLKIDRIFNWSPKAWIRERTEPGFNLVEKTHTKQVDCFPEYLSIAKKQKIVETSLGKRWPSWDSMKIGEMPDFQVQDLALFVKQNRKK